MCVENARQTSGFVLFSQLVEGPGLISRDFEKKFA